MDARKEKENTSNKKIMTILVLTGVLFVSLCMALPAKAQTTPSFTLLNDGTGLPSGNAGDTATLIGTGFSPNSEIYLTAYEGAVAPSDIGSAIPYPPLNNVDLNAATDDQGNIEIDSIQLPSMTGGTYTLEVTDGVNSAFQQFTILDQSINLGTSSGSAGDSVTVSGTGFAQGGTITGSIASKNGKRML